MANLDSDAPYKLCLAGDLKLSSTTGFLPPCRNIYLFINLFLLAEYSSTAVELVVDIPSDLFYCTACDWLEGQRFHRPFSPGCIVLHVLSTCSPQALLLCSFFRCCCSTELRSTG